MSIRDCAIAIIEWLKRSEKLEEEFRRGQSPVKRY
jgi:hypothetical protein